MECSIGYDAKQFGKYYFDFGTFLFAPGYSFSEDKTVTDIEYGKSYQDVVTRTVQRTPISKLGGSVGIGPAIIGGGIVTKLRSEQANHTRTYPSINFVERYAESAWDEMRVSPYVRLGYQGKIDRLPVGAHLDIIYDKKFHHPNETFGFDKNRFEVMFGAHLQF